jgi:hypothetical protein
VKKPPPYNYSHSRVTSRMDSSADPNTRITRRKQYGQSAYAMSRRDRGVVPDDTPADVARKRANAGQSLNTAKAQRFRSAALRKLRGVS